MRFTKGLFAAGVAAAVVLILIPKAAHAVVAALVQVTNTTANPVPALDTERNARVPYQSFQNVSCTAIGCVFQFSPAPANYRLVVENINATFQMSSSAVAPPFLFMSGYSFTGVIGGNALGSINQNFVAYFDPSDGGPHATVEASLVPSVNSAVLTGYLENCAVTGCPAITH